MKNNSVKNYFTAMAGSDSLEIDVQCRTLTAERESERGASFHKVHFLLSTIFPTNNDLTHES